MPIKFCRIGQVTIKSGAVVTSGLPLSLAVDDVRSDRVDGGQQCISDASRAIEFFHPLDLRHSTHLRLPLLGLGLHLKCGHVVFQSAKSLLVTSEVIYIAMVVLLPLGLCSSSRDSDFKVSVSCPSYEVAKMENITWIEVTWKIIVDHVKGDRTCLETHRDGQMVNDSLMAFAKKWFQEQGVETAGGITYTWGGSERSEAG
jgi:hypothetical protein